MQGINSEIMKRFHVLIITLILFMLCGCGARLAAVKEVRGPSYTINGKTYHIMKKVPSGYTQKGTASWYGPGFHGKKTSSGEKYDMHEFTAAHNVLPHNTVVRVTNLSNHREVVVRINDRGPFVGDRVIDLSLSAARAIGMVGPGTAPVKITVLEKSDKLLASNRLSRQPDKWRLRAPNPFYSDDGPRLLALSRN